MSRIKVLIRDNVRLIVIAIGAAAALSLLLLNRLGDLTGGLSYGEVQAGSLPVGWHGMYHHPLYLPLEIVRSTVFWLFPSHGQPLIRLPNVVFGALTITTFSLLIRLWHGRRIALMSGLLFATSAWTLHVSRLASYDVMYLLAIPCLLFINIALYRFGKNLFIWYGSLLALAMLLYIPGLIWLYIPSIYFIRRQLVGGWKHFKQLWQRSLSLLIGILPLPLLIIDLTRPGQLAQWLGLPAHFPTLSVLAKNFIAVPVHLFIRGPEYPSLWLGRTSILDIFTLCTCLIGLYFYATHLKAARSRLLASLLIIGWLLVALNGPVSLSLLVPLLYVASAMGIAYLIREWLRVFPLNPLARATGITLVSLVVCVASIYNLRSYFVAWPHNSATKATFVYHR